MQSCYSFARCIESWHSLYHDKKFEKLLTTFVIFETLQPMKPKIQTNKKGIFLVTSKGKQKAEKTNPYLKGYNHALKKGFENNTYSLDAYRWLYNIGYDAGISEYCRLNHPEEENK